jgi:hypothetical protein
MQLRALCLLVASSCLLFATSASAASVWSCSASWTFPSGDKRYEGEGPSEQAALNNAAARCALHQTDDYRRFCKSDPHGVRCDKTEDRASGRRGDVLASVARIPSSGIAEVDRPKCGSGNWAKCKRVCVSPGKGEKIVSYAFQLGNSKDLGGCPLWPDQSQGGKYETCRELTKCKDYSWMEAASPRPDGSMCVRARNWSSEWVRCVRIEAKVAPNPLGRSRGGGRVPPQPPVP